MGSVKDLKVIKEPSENISGEGIFVFSDRYSVFDWGEMPDHIQNKGEAINILSAYFFELLEKKGIKTHYKGILFGDNEKLFTVEDLKNEIYKNKNHVNYNYKDQNRFDKMKIKLVNVYKPNLLNNNYNYDVYKIKTSNFLLPLEIIYRNKITEGSSFLKRFRENKINLLDYDLDKFPEIDVFLNKPIFDFSTKLEITDRYINRYEAQKISGLNNFEMNKLIELLMSINNIISEEYNRLGFENIDGKIEVAFDENRDFMVVDVVGTLDECRFFYEGVHLSKEILRIYYRNSEWYKDLEYAKKKDRFNWKEICKSKPEKLPEDLKKAISSIYCYVTNKIIGFDYFKNIFDLKDSIKIIKNYIVV
ncbi:MAG: phosphoribosylaminoimidazolesuccinocarboxamide synthase [Spirochaetes bacterium]|nr:phosphoribosylaminoimidazolesuccinocarboxamide synthase [Spirochaetota bacterium]